MSSADRRGSTGRRLAALGALSSAGLAFAGTDAEAGVVVTTVNGTAGVNIGFAAGDLPSFAPSALPGGNSNIYIGRGSVGHSRSLFVSGLPAKSGFVIGDFERFGLNFVSTVQKGATNGHHGGSVGFLSGGFITVANSSHSFLGPFAPSYFLFAFLDAGQPLFGWIYGSLPDSSYDNMTFNLIAYAYDDTGAILPAGAVPEPGTAVQGLLAGALIGGAAGVRRWKKAKAQVA